MYTESDIYVRDQLLIQFMLNRMDEYSTKMKMMKFLDIEEDIYEEWIKWLKEMEERHAERSKI